MNPIFLFFKMVDDNLKDYVDNNIFTASARDVLEMCERDLSDYDPILIRTCCVNPKPNTEEEKKLPIAMILREHGLESLAKKALSNNCEFVTDLVVTQAASDDDYGSYDVMQFIGTGLIEKNS